MIARQDDEETPLLQQPIVRTPLPWDQFWIILFLQFPDSLVFQTLAPFTPQLIRDIGVTNGDESQVGHYVGILQSSYYTAQALTILHWSQLSDHIGRKPLILTAVFAIVVSMFSFGLSKTYVGLVLSRVFCGAFNGSNGIIKSMVMDITDTTNLPKAYGYMPLPWMLGAIVGPLIGGSLSRPADRFPEIFGRSELLKTYPYLLPGEGDAFKDYVWSILSASDTQPPLPSNYTLASSGEANSEEALKPLPLRASLTPKVLTVTASYVTMSVFYMAFNSILPLFYATPIELGGLSLDPPRIGAILAVSGVAHGAFQLLFYARLHDRFGAGAIHTTGVSSGIPIIVLFPVINVLARVHGMCLTVWLCVAAQHVLTTSLMMCNPCLVLFIRAAAPNRASLGATNGIIQMVAAGARIIAPASATSVFSYSIQGGHDTWLVYYFLMVIAFLAQSSSQLEANIPVEPNNRSAKRPRLQGPDGFQVTKNTPPPMCTSQYAASHRAIVVLFLHVVEPTGNFEKGGDVLAWMPWYKAMLSTVVPREVSGSLAAEPLPQEASSNIVPRWHVMQADRVTGFVLGLVLGYRCTDSLTLVERCIRDCVPACREQGKVVKSTTLRQSPKDTQWLAKLRCYSAATRLLPPGSPTPLVVS
ncbi:major facilitator superfamily domain-containing protein [Suillus americanus]|nr:major facilitator superfamily domain-containing protein [Suillus americanus]